ncbi:MAG: aminotransferase class III-fold pyridoxal phosphate-dependent enzyme [Syntrophobacterales bacterium]|nr:MAG: aminotransferase class III-fold pyridoxal phosphate-dependent enzyme [Syntrophobacterales bacterium]
MTADRYVTPKPLSPLPLPAQVSPVGPCIVSGNNDILLDANGHSCIDLFTGHGTVWLGHAHPQITTAVTDQLSKVWNTGGLTTSIASEARTLIESFFPSSHYLAALYSTGMEASEFALRMARSTTKKSGAIRFARNLHGKSLATAQLGWDNGSPPLLPGFHRLPFLPTVTEAEALKRLERTLSNGNISAVFIEPIQGSGGGHSASPHFYDSVLRQCRAHGALSIFDEILTGFYRTGLPFFFSQLMETPDIILVGKAMSNGFPASGVMVNREYPLHSDMLPGSTYAGNPLAAAAITATLRQMRALDMPGQVTTLEEIITAALSVLDALGIALRGKGALWVIELPPHLDVHRIAAGLYRRGVLVSYTVNQLRILPAATIEPDNLKHACAIIVDELTRICHDDTKN